MWSKSTLTNGNCMNFVHHHRPQAQYTDYDCHFCCTQDGCNSKIAPANNTLYYASPWKYIIYIIYNSYVFCFHFRFVCFVFFLLFVCVCFNLCFWFLGVFFVFFFLFKIHIFYKVLSCFVWYCLFFMLWYLFWKKDRVDILAVNNAVSDHFWICVIFRFLF